MIDNIIKNLVLRVVMIITMIAIFPVFTVIYAAILIGSPFINFKVNKKKVSWFR